MKRICMGLIAVAVLVAALAGCSAGSHAQPAAAQTSPWLAVARGEVDVQGGRVLVAARTDGVVESVAARSGEHVAAQQALAKFDPRAATIAVASAKAGVARAQAQADALRVSLRQASRHAPRVVEAAKAGAATGTAAEQARDAVASLKAKLAAAEADADVARQQLAAAKLQLDWTVMRAPMAGTVVSRRVAIGQSVSAAAGQPLFELLPDRPHIVRAQVDADLAGAIHPGMYAEVVRDSGTGPVHKATVLWVGEVLQPASLTQDPLQRAVANDVDCTLLLEPEADDKTKVPPLRIGQRVLVRFPHQPVGQRR